MAVTWKTRQTLGTGKDVDGQRFARTWGDNAIGDDSQAVGQTGRLLCAARAAPSDARIHVAHVSFELPRLPHRASCVIRFLSGGAIGAVD